MQDDFNLILQSILDEQKETRNDLKEIRSEMVTKDDLKELNREFDVQKAKCDKIEFETQKNTDFRQTFVGGARWFAGSVIVAMLGFFGSVAVAESHSTPQTVISAPHVIVQPVVRTVVPPMPDNSTKHH